MGSNTGSSIRSNTGTSTPGNSLRGERYAFQREEIPFLWKGIAFTLKQALLPSPEGSFGDKIPGSGTHGSAGKVVRTSLNIGWGGDRQQNAECRLQSEECKVKMEAGTGEADPENSSRQSREQSRAQGGAQKGA